MIAIHCKYDEMISVQELKKKFHPENRNQHPQEQIERLAKILQYQGVRRPVTISNQSGRITTGHGRTMSADFLGMDEFPVVYQDYEDETMEYADVQADNAIAEWASLDLKGINADLEKIGPMDIDLLGIRDFTVDVSEKLDPGCDEDHVPSNAPTRSMYGDIWQLGNHRVMCGDATNIQHAGELMQGEMAAMILTDPPYNVDYKGKTKDSLTIENDKMSDGSFLQFLTDSFTTYFSVCLEGAPIYIFHADSEGLNFRQAMKNAGFKMSQCLVWVKNSMVMGRQDYHWKHEPILYGWKEGKAHTWLSDRKQTTVWEFPRPNRNADHPTMKPVELLEYPIKNSSAVGSLVVDFFGGSGSTLIACEKTGRKCYTMELDPKYVDVILKRWEKYSKKEAELISRDELNDQEENAEKSEA